MVLGDLRPWRRPSLYRRVKVRSIVVVLGPKQGLSSGIDQRRIAVLDADIDAGAVSGRPDSVG